MSDDFEFSLSVPLDSDGFLRRECPTCEREFKWLPSNADADSAADAPRADVEPYFCPYCVVTSPPDTWLTTEQAGAINAVVMREVVNPMLDDFGKSIEQIGSQSDFLKVRFERDRDDTDQPELSEPDDMRRVEFPCHPEEPLKVLDAWSGDVHCLICGTPAPAD